MSVSLEYLERCSADNGFQVVILEKVVRLGELAGEVARHPFLGEVLALKGGTALNLCYGPPQRLSVDLDFNYIGQLDRQKMLEDRPRVEEAIVALAKRAGYRVQRSADAFAGRKLYLRYRSVLGQEDRIELDLNFLFRLPLVELEKLFVWQPGELDRPRICAVGLVELLIGKVLALLDRGAARDVWDVTHLPQSAADVIASPPFRAWFIGLSAILDHPLPTYTRSRLAGLLTERALVEQLAPMLAGVTTFRVEDMLARVWATVAPLLSLDAHEEAYLAAIEQGELKPELLFPDDSIIAARVAEHPAILWKIQNVRARAKRQGKRLNGVVLSDDRRES